MSVVCVHLLQRLFSMHACICVCTSMCVCLALPVFVCVMYTSQFPCMYILVHMTKRRVDLKWNNSQHFKLLANGFSYEDHYFSIWIFPLESLVQIQPILRRDLSSAGFSSHIKFSPKLFNFHRIVLLTDGVLGPLHNFFLVFLGVEGNKIKGKEIINLYYSLQKDIAKITQSASIKCNCSISLTTIGTVPLSFA